MLLGQRDVQSVIGSRGLQLKIEAAAESLAQRQSPGLVDPPAEGRVDHQLHPAAFVEEALGNDRVLRGDGAQYRAALQNVFDRLLGAGIIQPAFFFQPGNTGSRPRAGSAENPTGDVCGNISLIFCRNSATCSESS